MGMQPAISYNFGGKNFKRMYRIIRQTGIFTIILGLSLTIIAFIFKDALITAFINNADVISMGQIFVIAAVIVGPVYGIYQLSQTFLQATGKVTYAIFSSMLDKFLVFLPVLLFLDYKFGIYGIAFAHLSQTFLQATGKVTYAIFSSMLDKFLVFLPVLLFLDYKFGIYGIAFAHAVTMIFTLIITLFLALKWSKEIKRLYP